MRETHDITNHCIARSIMSVEPDQEPLFEADSDSKQQHQAFIPADFEEPATSSSAAGAGASANVSGRIDSNESNEPPPSYSAGKGIFTFGYYAHFFDVDTKDVGQRCLLALNPFDKTGFLEDDNVEQGQQAANGRIAGGNGLPDLYGPFWICTTVVLALFFSSTLEGILLSSWQGVKYEYKFDLLTGAAGLMYSYTFIVPVLLWIILRYLNIAPSTTLLQLVSLYGYSNVTWIPVAILSVSPLLGGPKASEIIRNIFIALGFTFSGVFIGKNIYRSLLPEHNASASDGKKAAIILGLSIVLHTALAFAVKILFFAGVEVKKDD